RGGKIVSRITPATGDLPSVRGRFDKLASVGGGGSGVVAYGGGWYECEYEYTYVEREECTQEGGSYWDDELGAEGAEVNVTCITVEDEIRNEVCVWVDDPYDPYDPYDP
ncbi:hypothetical protein, partial [Parapedobacter tibetensis]|uniref:hypothetical protein n=1 Tax=Parapedobacter tibetensis TaxID=2972951 RepID=UPI00214DEF86